MALMSRRGWLGFSATLLAGSARGLLAQESGEGPGPKTVTPRERIRERYFPDVSLLTHEGQKVRFYTDLLRDKVVTINFIYATCEKICPLVTRNLAKVQRLLGDRVGRDIFMYSITLKPERDTPAVLRTYAEAHHAGPGWLFLTGAAGDIELLRRNLGFVNPDPTLDADKSQHIGTVRYGNEANTLWGACPGMASPGSIVKSILWVVGEKSAQPIA